MFTVRGTKKFLDRVGRPMADPPSSTTVLGGWYANVCSGRRSGRPADLLGLSVWLANTIVGPIPREDGYTPLGVLQRVVKTVLPDN